MKKPEYPTELIEYNDGHTSAWFVGFVTQDPAIEFSDTCIQIVSMLSNRVGVVGGAAIIENDQIISRTVLTMENK
jgi:hypothetical protein